MILEKEYIKRRDKFASRLKNNSVALLISAKYKSRSNDTEYPYRQNSNFYYLSGFKEDKSCILFIKDNNKTKTYLFVQKKNKNKELWTGKRLGVEKAKRIFSYDDIFNYNFIGNFLKKLPKSKYFYYDFKNKDEKYLKQLVDKKSKDLSKIVEKMRLIKSKNEIKLIKKALEITKDAHHKVIKIKKKNKKEFELQAEIEYIFKKNGAYSDAYTSVVACGNSANTLHYISNNKPLVDGELILIDAGCEYEYYASDITRTIPVDGYFTDAQKEIYSLVLSVQEKIINKMKPNIKRSYLQEETIKFLVQGMIKLDILKGNIKGIIKKKKYLKYYPHTIGHWMGIDVHDEAPYKDKNSKEIRLKKGMVMTVEPGIYIDKNDKKVPKRFRGIGIRIEDDILITKKSNINLSSNIVKSIKNIEKLSS